ncbi:hypothetical protein MMC08_002504 [Hypocenomyce scalaris]|nr:hypothetical protein [Hypocenomyce scalaris]
MLTPASVPSVHCPEDEPFGNSSGIFRSERFAIDSINPALPCIGYEATSASHVDFLAPTSNAHPGNGKDERLDWL